MKFKKNIKKNTKKKAKVIIAKGLRTKLTKKKTKAFDMADHILSAFVDSDVPGVNKHNRKLIVKRAKLLINDTDMNYYIEDD
jgi:hypothetical protein